MESLGQAAGQTPDAVNDFFERRGLGIRQMTDKCAAHDNAVGYVTKHDYMSSSTDSKPDADW
jgi:hypothetical protein